MSKRSVAFSTIYADLTYPSSGLTALVLGSILSEKAAGQFVMTGHAEGLITLNLAEADDVERESRRVAFREPYRTLLGHLRHESGHFYWTPLVFKTNLIAAFCLIFGDDRQNYAMALERYHRRGTARTTALPI